MARGEVLVERFPARGQSVVEMERLDLQRQTPLDVLEAEITGSGMAGLDDVEEVGVGVSVEEHEIGRRAPGVDEVGIEVGRWITFDGGEGR